MDWVHHMDRLARSCFILVGGLEHVLFSRIFRIIIPIDFHIFQRGGSTTNQHFFGAKAEAVSKQQAPLSAGAAADSLRLLSRVSALVTGATPQNPYWGGDESPSGVSVGQEWVISSSSKHLTCASQFFEP